MEMIKIAASVINNESVNTVNARELHAYLGVGKDFSNQIKDLITKHNLVENIDYLKYSPNLKNKIGRNKIDYLISEETSELIKLHHIMRLNIHADKRKQEVALTTIEQILGVNLIREYICGYYRIDGYDEINKIAYEIDEDHHKYRVEEDTERENYIKNILNCSIVRVKLYKEA